MLAQQKEAFNDLYMGDGYQGKVLCSLVYITCAGGYAKQVARHLFEFSEGAGLLITEHRKYTHEGLVSLDKK